MPLVRVSNGGTPGASGSLRTSTTGTYKVTLGFRPRYVVAFIYVSTSDYALSVFDSDVSTTTVFYSNNNSRATYSIGSTSNNRIKSIDSDGFTMNKSGNSANFYYFAVG